MSISRTNPQAWQKREKRGVKEGKDLKKGKDLIEGKDPFASKHHSSLVSPKVLDVATIKISILLVEY